MLWLLLLLLLFCLSTPLIVYTDVYYVIEHCPSTFGLVCNETTANKCVGMLKVVEPMNGCEPIKNDIKGYFGLVIRDRKVSNCSFSMKVKNIEDAGGIGAIIMNQKPNRWEEDGLVRMGMSDESHVNISIPSAFVRYKDGAQIQDYLAKNSTLLVRISDIGANDNLGDFFSYALGYVFILVIIVLCFLAVGYVMVLADRIQIKRVMNAPSHVKETFYNTIAPKDVEEPVECSICLDTLKPDDVVFQLPCKHIFHKDCASAWIYEVKAVCPNCRKGIYDDDENNWLIENRQKDVDHLISMWEVAYCGSYSYVFTCVFSFTVILSPFVYQFFFCRVCCIFMWSRGEYFEQKNRRIVEQFKDEGKLVSSLFQGVVAYIDGQTRTPYQELRKIICDNGGKFEPALYKAKITHFIAENVSHAKLLDLQSKRNLYIVKPEWITDSVKAGKRLSETTYSLIRSEIGIDDKLHSHKESREEAVKDSYTPEKVFQKSRFHLMDIIKKKLQDQVNEHYNSNNQPIPMDPGEDCIYAHIDMDCYFVQIALLNAPQYKDQPVAVSSGDSDHSEVSSCNYKAREFGVKKGMWMKRAKDLCPSLIILPYDFEGIEKTSQKVVSIVLQYTSIVQVGSCDEIYCDLSFYKPNNQFLSILQSIKVTIKEQTGCTCTIGCSHNLLMARIATAKAKPDGFLYIPFTDIPSFLVDITVGSLPGVGDVIETKLQQINIHSCQDLLHANPTLLSNTVGEKTASQLIAYASGKDPRVLSVQPNVQSIGVQVSYGVRCQTRGDVVKYICSLCNMLVKKLQAQNMSGTKLTAKFYKRIPTEETAKFMGHGPVTIVNLSHTNGVPIAQYETLLRLAVMLYDNSHIQPEDIRGIGLLLKNLISQKEYSSIQTFFSSSSHTEPTSPHSPSTPIKKQSTLPITNTSVTPSSLSPSTPTRSPSSSSRRKRLSPSKSHKPLFPAKQANTIQYLLERNQQVKRTYGGSPIRPMIELPSLQELDLSVYQTLPGELQKEMARVYLQKEKDLTEEQSLLFQKVVNREDEDHEITAEERELMLFMSVVVKPVFSIDDRKLIAKYMKEYEVNSELEVVLEEIMKKKSKEDVYGAKELVGIMKSGLQRSGCDSWKSIVDRLSCIYEESLNSI